MEQCEVSEEVGRVCGEIGEGEREVVRTRKERVERQTHCRDTVAQIEVRTLLVPMIFLHTASLHSFL